METKAPQSYWERAYDGTKPFAAPAGHWLRRWIERYVPPTVAGSAAEIGCYPGRFLAVAGELGYEVNGVDLTPRVDEMPGWMSQRGYRVGSIENCDFFSWDPGRQFDVVLSLGFIEHFRDWELALERHANLVAPGGKLVIEAPNFVGGFQNWVHRTFDATNLAHHHLPAMDPLAWAARLRARGFEVEFSGFFGPFYIWVEPQQRGIVQRGALLCLRAVTRVLRPFVPNGARWCAPACGVVARKR